MAQSYLATDAASGAVVLAGETNAGQGGAYVQQILPSPGAKVVLGQLAKEWSDGLSARIGAPGVYVAMHNQVLRFPGVTKDRVLGTFVAAP